MVELDGLPGAQRIERGVAELARRLETVDALLVSVAPERLRALGIQVAEPLADPELRLYQRLRTDASEGDDPYVQYNALLRELDSFLEALEGRARRAAG
jgi:hypothetical protein